MKNISEKGLQNYEKKWYLTKFFKVKESAKNCDSLHH